MSDNECSAVEINFRLDHDGRTVKNSRGEDGGQQRVEQGQIPETTIVSGDGDDEVRVMDYTTNVAFISSLMPSRDASSQDLMDELLLDCEIADCGLMPRTFWIAANAEPRFRLEHLAISIFRHHAKGVDFDIETSGAEWWVQLRPSPEKTGRYAMHDKPENRSHDETNCGGGDCYDYKDNMSTTGISFHWDKDEELRILTDGSLHIHPHLSTVTYLTDLGCPTLVLNFRVDNFTGAWIAPTKPEGFVAWPKQGKHLSFDGRFLHAAPPDLMDDGVFAQQCQLESVAHQNGTEANKELRRRRRATFLVNVWLNYRPVQVDPFPETMIGKMSQDAQNTECWDVVPSTIDLDQIIVIDENKINHLSSVASNTSTRMTWAMGDCNSHETIEAEIPLEDVRKAGLLGGNVRVQWATSACGHRGLMSQTQAGIYLCCTRKENEPQNNPTESGEDKGRQITMHNEQGKRKREI